MEGDRKMSRAGRGWPPLLHSSRRFAAIYRSDPHFIPTDARSLFIDQALTRSFHSAKDRMTLGSCLIWGWNGTIEHGSAHSLNGPRYQQSVRCPSVVRLSIHQRSVGLLLLVSLLLIQMHLCHCYLIELLLLLVSVRGLSSDFLWRP